jgi:hypothetical protein
MKQIINPPKTARPSSLTNTLSLHHCPTHSTKSRGSDSSIPGYHLRTSRPSYQQLSGLASDASGGQGGHYVTISAASWTGAGNVGLRGTSAGLHSPSSEVLRAASITGQVPSVATVAGGIRERIGSVLPNLFSKQDEAAVPMWETSMLLGVTPHSSLERSLIGQCIY